jgi:hypothetical protein
VGEDDKGLEESEDSSWVLGKNIDKEVEKKKKK